MRNRIASLDTAKGIAILAVILGHYFQEFSPDKMNIVYCFHMPLFFLISGYCLSINKTFKDFAKSKIHRLLIPYAVTAVIWGCLQTLKSFIKNGALDGVKQAIKCIYAILYGGGQGQGSFYLTKSLEWKAIGCEVGMLWFLLALLWGSLFVYGIAKFKSRTVQCMVVIVIAMFGYLSAQYIVLPFSIQQGMLATSYLYIGLTAKQYGLTDKIKLNFINCSLCLIGFVSWILMSKFSLLEMYCNSYKYGILGWLTSIVISCFIIVICQLILSKNNTIQAVFSWLGKNSLIILCFHYIDARIFGFIVHRFASIFDLNFLLNMVIVFIGSCLLYVLGVCGMNVVKKC